MGRSLAGVQNEKGFGLWRAFNHHLCQGGDRLFSRNHPHPEDLEIRKVCAKVGAESLERGTETIVNGNFARNFGLHPWIWKFSWPYHYRRWNIVVPSGPGNKTLKCEESEKTSNVKIRNQNHVDCFLQPTWYYSQGVYVCGNDHKCCTLRVNIGMLKKSRNSRATCPCQELKTSPWCAVPR